MNSIKIYFTTEDNIIRISNNTKVLSATVLTSARYMTNLVVLNRSNKRRL